MHPAERIEQRAMSGDGEGVARLLPELEEAFQQVKPRLQAVRGPQP